MGFSIRLTYVMCVARGSGSGDRPKGGLVPGARLEPGRARAAGECAGEVAEPGEHFRRGS